MCQELQEQCALCLNGHWRPWFPCEGASKFGVGKPPPLKKQRQAATAAWGLHFAPPRIRPAPRELLDATTGILAWQSKKRKPSLCQPNVGSLSRECEPTRQCHSRRPTKTRRGGSSLRLGDLMRHCCARAVMGCLCAEPSAAHAQSRCLLKAPPCLPSVRIRQSPGCRKSKQTADSATRRAGSLSPLWDQCWSRPLPRPCISCCGGEYPICASCMYGLSVCRFVDGVPKKPSSTRTSSRGCLQRRPMLAGPVHW